METVNKETKEKEVNIMGKGYVFKDWSDDELNDFTNEAIRKLSKEDTNDTVYKLFATAGFLPDGGNIYSAQIIIWRQHDEFDELLGEGPSFGILVSISLFLGDSISEDLHAEYVPIEDHDLLRDKVKELYMKYHNEEEIDKFIKSYEEKERSKSVILNDIKVYKDQVINLDAGLKMLNKPDHEVVGSRELIKKRKELQYGQKSGKEG